MPCGRQPLDRLQLGEQFFQRGYATTVPTTTENYLCNTTCNGAYSGRGGGLTFIGWGPELRLSKSSDPCNSKVTHPQTGLGLVKRERSPTILQPDSGSGSKRRAPRTAIHSHYITPPTRAPSYVYMDEFVWGLGPELAGHFRYKVLPTPTFISLNNEPRNLEFDATWRCKGPNPVTSDNYIAKTIT